jgi:hypothetical protein
MFRTKTILMLAMVAAMAVSSYCPAAQIVHNWRFNTTSASFYDMTKWENINDANDLSKPDMARLTESEPNSSFLVPLTKSIRFQATSGTAVTNTPTGDWNITAPFTVVSAIPDTTQTMDPNLAPIRLNDISMGMLINSAVGGNLNSRIYTFSDLRLQGWIGGWRPADMHLAGKMTLTGPTAFGVSRDGTTNNWTLDAELDASAVDRIGVLFFSRDNGTPSTQGNHIKCVKTWFCGKWVLDSRMYADRAGCLGDADVQINGAGTPGLTMVTGVATPWVDRRSGNLWVTTTGAVSRNAKWTIDTTSVVITPATYGTFTVPAFTAANPQCSGGKVYVATAASPVYVRELWVNGTQKANGTYYATNSANSAWFGTASSYTGNIVVTGGTTRNVTMAAVLDPGALADANLAIYPASGLTKAFLEGYVLNLKARDPIVSSNGTGYKFVNWTSSTGSGIANTNAAQTALTVPTGSDITVTAHYVIAVSAPSPADTATQVPMTTNLDWTPGLATGTQELWFGTDPCNLVLKKSFANGLSHGATNAEIGGPLADTTLYYWAVKTNGQPGAIWQFRTEVRRPYVSNPVDGATGIERITPNLGWTQGLPSATKWDVYFGSSQSAVANAANTSDPTFLATRLAGDANEPNAPSGLRINTQYYWRVDEHNTYGTLKGFVWSFTTRGPLCMGIGQGDLNADCRVTFVDFALVAVSFFNN